MIRNLIQASLCLFASIWIAQGASIHGEVADASGGAIAGAHVGLFNRLGLIDERTTDRTGTFHFQSVDLNSQKLIVTATGFATKTLSASAGELHILMDLAPVEDSIRIAGSTIDVPASEQASSVSVITSDEIRERNESQASELMRTLPGVVIAQSGGRGGVTSAYIRGGESTYALVTIDGVPVNSFAYGGGFDFSQIPTDFLERIEVVRGAQSAVYGSYANSGVVNFVTPVD